MVKFSENEVLNWKYINVIDTFGKVKVNSLGSSVELRQVFDTFLPKEPRGDAGMTMKRWFLYSFPTKNHQKP